MFCFNICNFLAVCFTALSVAVVARCGRASFQTLTSVGELSGICSARGGSGGCSDAVGNLPDAYKCGELSGICSARGGSGRA